MGHICEINALACTPDGATLASASEDHTVRLWRLSDGSCTAVLEGHTRWVVALACTPDGATLASASWDHTVRLWRLADNTCTAVLEGHTNFVDALACTPDGATLASGSWDNTVRLWRLADNTCNAVLKGHTNEVRALACTPDGATVASGSGDNTVRLWRNPLLSILTCNRDALTSALTPDTLANTDIIHQLFASTPTHLEAALPFLLQHFPASVMAKDEHGRLALDVARATYNRVAVRLLQRATDGQRLLALGARPLDALKLFLCGDSCAGKTTLAGTLLNTRHDPFLQRTAGIVVRRATFALPKRTAITLFIHDFAGHSQFHAMHELILAEPNATFLVLVDASRPPAEQRRHLFYWLRLIATRIAQAQRLTPQPDAKPTVLVLGTHADAPSARGDSLRASLKDALAAAPWHTLLDIRADDFALITCTSKPFVVAALQGPLQRAWQAIAAAGLTAPTILDKLGPILARLGKDQPLWTLDDLTAALQQVTIKKRFGRVDTKASDAVQAMQGDVLAATLRCVGGRRVLA